MPQRQLDLQELLYNKQNCSNLSDSEFLNLNFNNSQIMSSLSNIIKWVIRITLSGIVRILWAKMG